jgi:acyl-CoA synthetase (AMP-forming)/AMP-acid ligase II
MPLAGPLLGEPVQVPTLLARGLASNPDDSALASAGTSLSWRELETLSTRLAANLLRLGLRPGDRVASLMPNRPALAVHYLACLKAGLVATPLNYRYTAPEIDHALEVSDAAVLLAHGERHEDLAASRCAKRLRVGLVSYGAGGRGPSFDALTTTDPARAELPEPDPGAPAILFFTSGSTGPAKGVTHTLETIGWMFASTASVLELTPNDVFLPASSMSHIGAFLWTFSSLAAGARVVVARTFDGDEVLHLLRTERPTILSMIPAALLALVRDHDATASDFSSLRLCRSGADKVTAELQREFFELGAAPIDEGYGMTEVGIATMSPPYGTIKEGSIGRPIPGFTIAIRDDDGNEVPTGTAGRVWIKSPTCTVGYWRDPAATAAVLREGWLDSGDLVHADEDGYLWFFGRKKQIIVHDGSNISPQEVEAALAEHPSVDLTGVIGVHDLMHGENVRAYVVVKAGAARPTSQELIRFARERVGYKAPEEIVFMDEIPLNPTGKVDRPALKRLAEEHLMPYSPSAPSR